MTNPTDIPTNWQGGTEGMEQASEEEQLKAAAKALEENLNELKEALDSGEIDQETYDKLSEAVTTMKEQMERGEVPELPFDPNEPLPVLMGMLAGNMISLFTPVGATMWVVDDPERLGELLGRNLLPRTITTTSGLKEVGVLHISENRLTVAERIADDSQVPEEIRKQWDDNDAVSEPTVGEKLPDGTEVMVRHHVFNLDQPGEIEDNPWMDVEKYLRRLAQEASARGEYTIVEKASDMQEMDPNATHPEHYVLFGVFPGEGDTDQAVIETYPHPEDAQFWDQVERPAEGPTMVAAAANTDLADQGSIATVAAASWNIAPWDLLVSFAPVPPRPGTPEYDEWQQAIQEAEAQTAAAQAGVDQTGEESADV